MGCPEVTGVSPFASMSTWKDTVWRTLRPSFMDLRMPYGPEPKYEKKYPTWSVQNGGFISDEPMQLDPPKRKSPKTAINFVKAQPSFTEIMNKAENRRALEEDRLSRMKSRRNPKHTEEYWDRIIAQEQDYDNQDFSTKSWRKKENDKEAEAKAAKEVELAAVRARKEAAIAELAEKREQLRLLKEKQKLSGIQKSKIAQNKAIAQRRLAATRARAAAEYKRQERCCQDFKNGSRPNWYRAKCPKNNSVAPKKQLKTRNVVVYNRRRPRPKDMPSQYSDTDSE